MYKIYRLVYKGKIVYVGITKQELKKRKQNGYHRIPELDEIKNECDMELIETTDDRDREHFWISYYGFDNLMNKKRGFGSKKSEYNKIYYEESKDRLKPIRKKWQQENKDKYKIYKKTYLDKNRDEVNRKQLEKYHQKKKEI